MWAHWASTHILVEQGWLLRAKCAVWLAHRMSLWCILWVINSGKLNAWFVLSILYEPIIIDQPAVHLPSYTHAFHCCWWNIYALKMYCLLKVSVLGSLFITLRVSRRRCEMYCGHARLCVCLSTAACLHYCMDPDVTWGSGRGCPLVVHYWADLQSVYGLRCYDNITWTWNVSEDMHVLALCLVVYYCHIYMLSSSAYLQSDVDF